MMHGVEMNNDHILRECVKLKKRMLLQWVWVFFNSFLLSLIGLFCMHGYDEYGLFYDRNVASKESAVHLWEVCSKQLASDLFHLHNLNCESILHKSKMNVHARAIEDTVSHMLQDLNIFSYLPCYKSSACEFVLLQGASILFASIPSFFLCCFIVGVLMLYHIYKSPVQTTKKYNEAVNKVRTEGIRKSQEVRQLLLQNKNLVPLPLPQVTEKINDQHSKYNAFDELSTQCKAANYVAPFSFNYSQSETALEGS
jgi:hypothetical protein